jgi:hypothetical protein
VIRPPSFGKGLDVATTAENLLNHVVAHWAAAAPGTAEPLPERRLIPPGDPHTVAWDCEQLTISLEGIGFGQAVDAGAESSPRAGLPFSANSLRHAVLAVSLVRCTPSPNGKGEVSSTALHAAGLTFLRDSGMLSQALVTFAGLLRAQLSEDASVQCGAVTPFGPSGGYHAAEASMAITVPELI